MSPSSSSSSYELTFDFISLCLIAALLFLSFISLAFVLYLRLKTRIYHHLQGFNTLWTVRFLLISFVVLWALNELFRSAFFRQQYLYPSLPYPPTLAQQTHICKINVVLSLGFFEPGFLIILLFLVNVSVKKKTPRGSWVLVFVSGACFPVLILHILFVLVLRLDERFPDILLQDSAVLKGDFGGETLLCSYPLISCIIFGSFGIWYSIFFSLSCFKVVTLAINKGMRVRIYGLAFAVLMMLPLQMACLVLSVFWGPEETPHDVLTFLVFLCTLLLAAVGEGILVIRPVADSLAAGGESCWQLPSRLGYSVEAELGAKV